MSAALALLLQIAATTAPPAAPAPGAALSSPPADWSAMPSLGATPPTADPLSDYVRDEVRAGRCAAASPSAAGQQLSVDLAVLVAGDGSVRRILPRAIGCATVEQYATGLASRLIRRTLAAPGSDTWYRTTLAFTWAR